LGTSWCKFKHCCILEGGVVVYSDKEQKILSLNKLRKHISRSGRFIGTGEDSQAHEWEHLMIVYYKVLRADDESLSIQLEWDPMNKKEEEEEGGTDEEGGRTRGWFKSHRPAKSGQLKQNT
jgi:hypothetical protein